MLGSSADHIGTKFRTVLDQSLADSLDTKAALLSAYDTPEDGGNLGFLQFAHDAVQLAATRLIAYVFHFNEPNPWEGRFKGVAGHLTDTAFLFQNYEEYLDEERALLGREFGRHLGAL